ncbi:MAG: hypothetical protein U1F67_11830 [Rubrivivax sp.]
MFVVRSFGLAALGRSAGAARRSDCAAAAAANGPGPRRGDDRCGGAAAHGPSSYAARRKRPMQRPRCLGESRSHMLNRIRLTPGLVVATFGFGLFIAIGLINLFAM